MSAQPVESVSVQSQSQAPVTDTPKASITEVPKLVSKSAQAEPKQLTISNKDSSEQIQGVGGINEWYLKDGLKGEGERPPYLLEKYGYNLEKQAKAYPELEKALGASGRAPDEYDWGTHKELFDLTNPHMQEFMNYAKQNRINQEAFSKIVDTFVNYAQSSEPNISQEIARLGPDGAMKFETVTRWVQNNLSQKACDTITGIINDANVIELLDEMRQLQYHHSTQPPSSYETPPSFTPLTRQEIEAEMASNYSKYCNDPRYRAEIAYKLEQAIG